MFPNPQLRLSSHVCIPTQIFIPQLRSGLDTVVSDLIKVGDTAADQADMNELGLIINFFPHLLTINITKAD